MNEPVLDRLAGESPISLGKRLAKARKTRGWTLGYAASQLRLPESTVELLESDDYTRLPAEVYVKGYLRNYARLLRLAPEEIVQAYIEQRGTAEPLQDAQDKPRGHAAAASSATRRQVSPIRPTQTRRDGYREQPTSVPPYTALGWIGAALVLGYVATWWWPDGTNAQLTTWLTELRSAVTTSSPSVETNGGADGNNTEPATDSPAADSSLGQPQFDDSAPRGHDVPQNMNPVAEEPAAPRAAAANDVSKDANPDTLSLRFDADSWATVIDADGKRLLHQTGEKGTTKTVTGKAPFNLTIGRIANVSIEFNGQPVDFPNAKNRATERFAVPLRPRN